MRRLFSTVERWFWIADQVSPLNVVARVRVEGHIPEGVLERAAAVLAAEYPLLRRLVEEAATNGNAVGSRRIIGAPEDLLPARYRGPRGITRLAAIGLADGLARTLARPCRLNPESMVDPARQRPGLIRRMLTSTQLDILMRRCRKEGVTIHGGLAAATAMVIGPAAAQRTSGRMCIGSPIDFRAELVPPVSADEAGSYVSSVPSIVRFGGDRDLWAIARKINRSLGRRSRFGQHLSMLWALRFICPASVAESCRIFRLMERSGPLNVGIWTIGRYEFPARIGDWQLSGAQFITGVLPFGYLAATVNTSHGELFWNFTYTDGAVSHRSAQRFADGCLHTLLRAIA